MIPAVAFALLSAYSAGRMTVDGVEIVRVNTDAFIPNDNPRPVGVAPDLDDNRRTVRRVLHGVYEQVHQNPHHTVRIPVADQGTFGEDLDDDVAEPERWHLADGDGGEPTQIALVPRRGRALLPDEPPGQTKAGVDDLKRPAIPLIGPLR